MKKEIEAAGAFLKNLVKRSDKLNSEQADVFVEHLIDILQEKYKAHWYPENPTKGQAFRCIRVNGHHSKDAELLLACQKSGVQYCYLGLPLELTLWVDPGEVSCRYSEDTPPFTLASIIGDDDDDDDDDNDNEKVLLKVRSALEKVTSDYHSETSSDDDCVCISPPPENDSAYTTPPSERDSDSGKASQIIFGVTSSLENNTFSGTFSPPNRRGGAATPTPPQHRSPPLQVVYSSAPPLSPLSWRIPVRSPVEPRSYFMLNTRVRAFPTVRPHGWSRPVYRNPMWSCPSARSHQGSTSAFWSSAGNERRFDGRMNLSRPLK
ncbi:uncharacterized protein LOC143112247 [Alosa pseudoharengus]|uniref:uncharacterized protein LOC143112247 n=1 Tax=Alosa pseudoharengus TaxID=34774 RepID=UPI003F88B057